MMTRKPSFHYCTNTKQRFVQTGIHTCLVILQSKQIQKLLLFAGIVFQSCHTPNTYFNASFKAFLNNSGSSIQLKCPALSSSTSFTFFVSVAITLFQMGLPFNATG